MSKPLYFDRFTKTQLYFLRGTVYINTLLLISLPLMALRYTITETPQIVVCVIFSCLVLFNLKLSNMFDKPPIDTPMSREQDLYLMINLAMFAALLILLGLFGFLVTKNEYSMWLAILALVLPISIILTNIAVIAKKHK